MSSRTRYVFAIAVSIYSIYQMTNQHVIAGLLGVGLAVGLVWLGRRR